MVEFWGCKIQEFVVTSCIQHFMPIIRYNTGDIVQMIKMKRCKCGEKNVICMKIDEKINASRSTALLMPNTL